MYTNMTMKLLKATIQPSREWRINSRYYLMSNLNSYLDWHGLSEVYDCQEVAQRTHPYRPTFIWYVTLHSTIRYNTTDGDRTKHGIYQGQAISALNSSSEHIWVQFCEKLLYWYSYYYSLDQTWANNGLRAWSYSHSNSFLPPKLYAKILISKINWSLRIILKKLNFNAE